MRWGRVAISLVLTSAACLDLGVLDTSGDSNGGNDAGSEVYVEPETGPDTATTTGCDGGSGAAPEAGCIVMCNGLTCAAHETCNGGASPPACECVIGYTKGAAGCTFTGGPLDPGFQNSPPSWTIEPADAGVSVRPSDDGGVDPGALVFSNDCKPALAKQTFPMPPYASAEPLALELEWRTNGSTAVEIDIAGRTFPFILSGSTFHPTRICLGDSAYGGDIELVMRRTNQCGFWAVDRAAIVPDATCLAPGTVLSPDFQTPGWTPTGGAETTTSGLSGLSGRLPTTNPCQVPKITGMIHIPSTAHPALAISYKGTTKVNAELGLSGGRFGSGSSIPVVPFAQVVGTSALERVNVCLPDWARGTVRALELSMPARGTTCSDTLSSEFLFDDLAIVEDPTCESPGTVFDPGFERSVQSAKVVYSRGPKGNFDYTPSFQKLTGNGVLHVKTSYPDCSTTSSSTQTASVFVSGPRPPTSGAAGAPKLTFNYRAAPATSLSYTVAGQALDTAATTYSGCLSRSLAGQGFTLDFAATHGCPSGSNGDLYVDDVALAWEPACP